MVVMVFLIVLLARVLFVNLEKLHVVLIFLMKQAVVMDLAVLVAEDLA